MSVRPEDFIESAKHIAGEDSEMGWRNATSRAYYAMFHLCREHARANADRMDYIEEQQRGSHQVVIDAFRMEGRSNQTYRSIAYILSNCKGLREKADYEIDLVVTRFDFKQVVDGFQKVRSSLDTLESNP